jgi:hypothetical protein
MPLYFAKAKDIAKGFVTLAAARPYALANSAFVLPSV